MIAASIFPILLVAAAPQESLAEVLGRPPPERGVALGLFSQEADYSYRPFLDEIRALGANHVEIAWVVWQEDLYATEIASIPGWSPTDAQIRESMAYARSIGLVVTAFPILRLKRAEKRDEWRGRIAPKSEDAWWDSYTAFIAHAAELASSAKARRIAVGSELISREAMRARWSALIARVRVEHPDLEILYSANWDHFLQVSFWDLVDVVGVTAYFELTKDRDASVATLRKAWTPIVAQLDAFSARLGRKLLITEIGYPSLDGAAVWPWDHTSENAIDLEEQRRAYQAFALSFSDAPFLKGVVWWNWFGEGGASDRTYTPRKKPAARVLQDWFQR